MQAQGGVTLLEMLVCLTVLSIGVMGYLALHYHSIYGRVFAKRMNEAVLAGDTQAEWLLTGNFAQLDDGSDTGYMQYGGNDEDGEQSDYESGKAQKLDWAIYEWNNITDNPNSELNKLKTLSMGVHWKEKEELRAVRVHTVLRGGRSGDTEEDTEGE